MSIDKIVERYIDFKNFQVASERQDQDQGKKLEEEVYKNLFQCAINTFFAQSSAIQKVEIFEQETSKSPALKYSTYRENCAPDTCTSVTKITIFANNTFVFKNIVHTPELPFTNDNLPPARQSMEVESKTSTQHTVLFKMPELKSFGLAVTQNDNFGQFSLVEVRIHPTTFPNCTPDKLTDIKDLMYDWKKLVLLNNFSALTKPAYRQLAGQIAAIHSRSTQGSRITITLNPKAVLKEKGADERLITNIKNSEDTNRIWLVYDHRPPTKIKVRFAADQKENQN